MSFSSLEFIFIFFPIFISLYLLVPNKYKNIILVLGSIIFYYIGVKDPIYLIMLILSLILNYILGLCIDLFKYKKFPLIFGILINFGSLFVFKYLNFFSKTVTSIINADLFVLNLVLPLGISFYTFQVTSYLVDVYRGKTKSEKSFIDFTAYATMFPKFLSGPITTYPECKKYLKVKKVSINDIEKGIMYFVIGLSYKVLLANRIGGIWSNITAVGFDSISTPLAIIGLVAFSLQLYFDFQGYSVMAIGLAKIMGFELPRNFDYPYLSLSMTDFWRRWHMTLGNWFKEYLYFPLGGSRKGKFNTIRNLFVVWLFTGLWHGADWNFVIWGLSIFVIIVIEKLFLKKYLDKYPLIGHIYMIILIPLTWMIFAINDLNSIKVYFNSIIKFALNPDYPNDYIQYIKDYGLFLVLGILFSTRIPQIIHNKNKFKWIEKIAILILFWLSIYCLCKESNDPFMYFKF